MTNRESVVTLVARQADHMMTGQRSFSSLLAVTLAVLAGAPRSEAESDRTHRVALAAGFDGVVVPEFTGHGYGLVAYDLEGLAAGSHLGLSYNTDTARVSFDRIRFANGWLEAGAHGTYEFMFAGLFTDYFRGGQLDPGRSFNAGYLEFDVYLKGNLPRDSYLEIALAAQRWFFDRNSGTDAALTLPPESWVIKPRLRYTFWRLTDDPSLREAHRPFPRARGAAFGVELGLDYRTAASPWGALDADQFDPVDPRNPGEPVVLLFRQWLRAGWQLHDRVRLQVAQFAGTGMHEDDLTRTRLGGSNPYVVPLAGAPWAAVLAGTFISAELSLHVRIWRELELGFLAQGAAVEDLQRIGENDLDFVGGLGAFADFRINAFQIDLRSGWTPSLRADPMGHWNVFLSFGWQWQSPLTSAD